MLYLTISICISGEPNLVYNDICQDLLAKGGELIEDIDTAGVVGGPTQRQVQNGVKWSKRTKRGGGVILLMLILLIPLMRRIQC